MRRADSSYLRLPTKRGVPYMSKGKGLPVCTFFDENTHFCWNNTIYKSSGVMNKQTTKFVGYQKQNVNECDNRYRTDHVVMHYCRLLHHKYICPIIHLIWSCILSRFNSNWNDSIQQKGAGCDTWTNNKLYIRPYYSFLHFAWLLRKCLSVSRFTATLTASDSIVCVSVGAALLVSPQSIP